MFFILIIIMDKYITQNQILGLEAPVHVLFAPTAVVHLLLLMIGWGVKLKLLQLLMSASNLRQLVRTVVLALLMALVVLMNSFVAFDVFVFVGVVVAVVAAAAVVVVAVVVVAAAAVVLAACPVVVGAAAAAPLLVIYVYSAYVLFS